MPIYLVKKKINPEVDKITFQGRSFAKLSSDEFKENIKSFPVNLILSERNPSKAWDIYYHKIIEIMNEFRPMKTFTTKITTAPYVTKDLIQLSKTRDKLFKKAFKSKNDQDWDAAIQSRSEANTAIRKARRSYILDEFISAQGNPIKFWETMKKLIPSSKTDTIQSVFDTDGVTLLHGKEAANRINTYFCNISSVLDAELPQSNGSIQDTYNESIPSLKSIDKITLDELITEIKKIDISKGSGLLGVSTKLLKTIFSHTPTCLLHIMNQCLMESEFPDSWKLGVTSAIPKKGDHRHISNIRPISILPLPGKLLEKFINKKLITHLELNNLICKEQGGFRKKHSTAQSCFDILHSIYNAINQNNRTIITYINFAKAFNVINHNLLTKKLKNLGIMGNFQKLIRNYLKDRKQVVKLENCISDVGQIHNGVPQGSILGPTLFLAYINDLKECKLHGNINLYADDTAIYISHPDIKIAAAKMNDDLTVLLNGH